MRAAKRLRRLEADLEATMVTVIHQGHVIMGPMNLRDLMLAVKYGTYAGGHVYLFGNEAPMTSVAGDSDVRLEYTAVRQ